MSQSSDTHSWRSANWRTFSRAFKKHIIIYSVLIVIVVLPLAMGVTYLAWFAKQGISSGNAAKEFYQAVLNKEDISPYLCDEDGGIRAYLLEQESQYGEIDDVESLRRQSSKRKRGERFPEKKFITEGLKVTRGGLEFYPEVEVHKEDGEYKVCRVEEKTSLAG